jgi:hypothetical protein
MRKLDTMIRLLFVLGCVGSPAFSSVSSELENAAISDSEAVYEDELNLDWNGEIKIVDPGNKKNIVATVEKSQGPGKERKVKVSNIRGYGPREFNLVSIKPDDRHPRDTMVILSGRDPEKSGDYIKIKVRLDLAIRGDITGVKGRPFEAQVTGWYGDRDWICCVPEK